MVVVLVEVAMRVVVLIRVVDTCRLKTLEVVTLLMVLLGMVLVMVMAATVLVTAVLEGTRIQLVRHTGIQLVSLELGLEVVQEVHGEDKLQRVTVMWDMEMLLLRGLVVRVPVQQ
uniref:Uncharacterized protein n=1 Tax=Brassica campestris TaxID=3711 RepID=A0A3P5ZX25_BRACM|nr:unnamed protein product [Brassica rapa]